MNNHLKILVISVLFIYIVLSGCTGEINGETNEISVEILSNYSYDAMGDIKVDGVTWGGAYSPADYSRTYIIDKNELSVKKEEYSITLMLESGAVKQEATANNVTSYVKFHVGETARQAEFGLTYDHYIEVVEVR